MKFKFKIQQYQTDAVEQTVNVFAGQPSKTNAQYRRDLGKRKGQITFEEEYVGWRTTKDGKHSEAFYFAYYSRELGARTYLCMRKMKNGGVFKPYAIID